MQQGNGPWRPMLASGVPGSGRVAPRMAQWSTRLVRVFWTVDDGVTEGSARGRIETLALARPRSSPAGSNRFVGVGDPATACLFRSRRRGTSARSLTKRATLNMFDEDGKLRLVATRYRPAGFSTSATRAGADALGCWRSTRPDRVGRRGGSACIPKATRRGEYGVRRSS